MPSAVVLAIDGLGSKFLGPYGNTWIETPAFNQLAAESLLIDGLFVPSTDRLHVCDSWWNQQPTNLLHQRHAADIHTRLLTDERAIWDGPQARLFAQQDQITASSNGVRLAEDWQETQTAKFFAQAIQAIEEMDDNSLLWLHFRGFQSPWDAPYEYRQQFVDEDDPDASGSAQVPGLHLDANYDPDALHEIQCAYAGQVVLLDECLAVLLAVMEGVATTNDAMLLVTSTGGFPLGEHLTVGCRDAQLYHESLAVPALLRYPQGQLAMKRGRGLAEVPDMAHALNDWLLDGQIARPRMDRAFSVFHQVESAATTQPSWLLRTPAWHARFSQLTDDREQDLGRAELYLQPDDQNEVNDVSDRCENVVDAGREFLLQWSHAGGISKLPEILLDPLE